jgi:GNAT superfamily N-acetyltransferase
LNGLGPKIVRFVTIQHTDTPATIEGGDEFHYEVRGGHYLVALLDAEPVGQIGLHHDGIDWWMDQMFVHPSMRGCGLALALIEANHHLAISLGARSLRGRARKDHGAVPATFTLRNSERFSLGDKVQVTHDTADYIYVHRNLEPLIEKLRLGTVQRLEFPHRVELQSPPRTP